jgi:signal transduction histidine kinase
VLSAPRTPAAASRAVATILRQVTALAGLVNTLLDASRKVAGQLVLQPAVGDVREVVSRALGTVATRIRGRRASRAIPTEPVPMAMDAPALERAFVQVLKNAATHTSQEGVIRVHVTTTPEVITVQVRDTGAGIAPADLAHVFELFGRGGNAQGNGFGLGLAVARSLVEQHGGQITIASDGVGAGTDCTVWFPRTWPGASAAAA